MGGKVATVAVWISSTAVLGTVWAKVGPAAADRAGDRAAAAETAEAVLGLRRPTAEHLVPASVGVARARQGQGLGAAAVAAGLVRADQEGMPVHLETSEARNLRFYQRLGFAITDVVDLPDGGPRTWLMRREPDDHA